MNYGNVLYMFQHPSFDCLEAYFAEFLRGLLLIPCTLSVTHALYAHKNDYQRICVRLFCSSQAGDDESDLFIACRTLWGINCVLRGGRDTSTTSVSGHLVKTRTYSGPWRFVFAFFSFMVFLRNIRNAVRLRRRVELVDRLSACTSSNMCDILHVG